MFQFTGSMAVVAILAWLAAADSAVAAPAQLYVAVGGNDAWSGKIAQPNADKSDGPLANLQGARDALRRMKKAGTLTDGAVVTIADGLYTLKQALELTAEDSGGQGRPIIYQAQRGATVRLSAGSAVVGFQPVSEPSVLARLPEEARGKVMVADLKAQGITDYGKLTSRGFGGGAATAEAELFHDDVPMTLSRWPNSGFRAVKSVKDPQTVEVDTDRMARWADEAEPWVFAYWHYDWAELYEPLAGFDAAGHTLSRRANIRPAFGIEPKEARWYGLNLLSELDSAGEYYLDRQAGKLYFWPPKATGQAILSTGEALIRANNTSFITISGFILENCRGTAISLRDGTDCKIVGCVIRNTGKQAVQVSGGMRHEVYGCDVYYTGESGITMNGGQRPTLTPAGHNVENNHVHHFSRRARTYNPGISIGGVGNRMAHNLIHDGPHMALSAGGNDHIVEFNEIHNVVEESGDAGAYYVGRDWTQRGNILRHNYFHQILGSTGYGGMTIYLDDQHCGHAIYGNIFERCSQTIFIGGGDDNLVTNNVFLDCWKSAHLDDRGMNWQKKATDDPNGELRSRLRAMPYQNPLWKQRYPTLAGILDDDPGVPKRNVYAGNISAGGIWYDISPAIRKHQTVEKNLAFDDDKEWAKLIKDAGGKPLRLEFKDPAAVAEIGFKPIPVEKIGLYADVRRASWPVPHQVRAVKLPEGKKRPK